ncbi:2-amino-4-hydroxy-6-hydroxymethyldihydropteridine diphosphokinase [Metasolibacillus fluoroglycofenilyticus]|uniref:2-amino-4-hydroxy-6- hydroxymethyldihydropteridine diphosphokinase n=1 Tax=Metasolibacillus fluoroglycofenilyticus TaxID=1239396 RepID=UPI000D38B7B1|nr:2-amino-4-hydroxy-6-hydroxymethyldihydropteridine diphosphokinase [Metasolibacillus fluoroglycofenilyticus]
MNDVFLSIGTNIGEREANLQQAVQLLQAQVEVVKVSSIYETAPVGYTDQPSFLNIAVHVRTTRSATEMLALCQAIENELGRVRDIRWGPRIIDLDILLFNQEIIATEHLLVPHPRMYERAFVVVPLVEISKSFESEQMALARDTLDKLDLQQEGIILWKEFE